MAKTQSKPVAIKGKLHIRAPFSSVMRLCLAEIRAKHKGVGIVLNFPHGNNLRVEKQFGFYVAIPIIFHGLFLPLAFGNTVKV